MGSSGFCAKLQTTAQAGICARCAIIGFPRAEVGGRVGLHAERAGSSGCASGRRGRGSISSAIVSYPLLRIAIRACWLSHHHPGHRDARSRRHNSHDRSVASTYRLAGAGSACRDSQAWTAAWNPRRDKPEVSLGRYHQSSTTGCRRTADRGEWRNQFSHAPFDDLQKRQRDRSRP